MSTQTLNLTDSKELYSQYSWYRDTFMPVIQHSSDEFFLEGLKFEMIGLSKNINALVGKEFYFVTKVRINKNYDLFFRTSDSAISVILDKALGKSNKSFNLNRLTDLEAKIITTFNDYLYNQVSTVLEEPPAGELHRTNFDMINLTFILKDEEVGRCGKFVVSIPEMLVKPENVVSGEDKFGYDNFSSSLLEVKLKIGSTKFKMYELKNLDAGDTVVFDDSNIRKMTIEIGDYIKEVNLNPNMELLKNYDDINGGYNMGAENLWDSIEVDMTAQFDAVKITLGDLKAIEQGAVVDLTSIYGNKVSLYVEDKIIARGELVIVNDRYGVKIENVIAKGENEELSSDNDFIDDEFKDEFSPGESSEQMSGESDSSDKGDDDEFDYSDFELDDEDI